MKIKKGNLYLEIDKNIQCVSQCICRVIRVLKTIMIWVMWFRICFYFLLHSWPSITEVRVWWSNVSTVLRNWRRQTLGSFQSAAEAVGGVEAGGGRKLTGKRKQTWSANWSIVWNNNKTITLAITCATRKGRGAGRSSLQAVGQVLGSWPQGS